MFSNTMDLATLAAFAATYPTIFEEFMRDAAEHIVLDTTSNSDTCLRVHTVGRYGPKYEYVPSWDSSCLAAMRQSR